MWLLNQAEFEQLERLVSSDQFAPMAAAWKPEEEVEAKPRGYTVAGKVARIQVQGVLTPKPSFMSFLMGGGTTYRQISEGLDAAMSDPTVKSIELAVDSPGGSVEGLFELFDKIRTARDAKGPINVIASRAQSAAYGIAAVAGGKIIPTSVASPFGSVGVRVQYLNSQEIVNVTSTNAPNKAPDLSTEEGLAVVRAELDQIHDLFVGAIAEGRSIAKGDKITAEDVNRDFGQGGSMVAGLAYSAGLIDAKPKSYKPRRGMLAAEQAEERKTMKFSEFAAQFPEEAKAALNEAREEACAAERKRCSTHYGLASKSGDYAFAAECVANGTEATDPVVLYSHLESGGKGAKVKERQEASETVESAVAGVTNEGAQALDMGDAIASIVLGEAN